MKLFLQDTLPQHNAVPGAVIAIQTFGDFLGFNPHCHILCTDGCFYGNGMFRVAPAFNTRELEKFFQHQILKMLLSKGKVPEDLVNMLLSWRHSGFNVFCGPRIHPREEEAMENLARYIIRASFSQERMAYIPEESRVIYKSKNDKKAITFDALEWLAAMCSYVPNKGEQMVRYYGYYSNVSRGKRKKQDMDESAPYILESEQSSKESRKNWARLIQKIYEVDTLTCPKCASQMRVISVIEDEDVIKKILKHLCLWDRKARPPPRATGPPKTQEYKIDFSTSPLPKPARRSSGGSDKWLYVDPQYPESFTT